MASIGPGYKRRSGSGRSHSGIGWHAKPDRKRPVGMKVDGAIDGDGHIGIGRGATHGRGCDQGDQTEEECRKGVQVTHAG